MTEKTSGQVEKISIKVPALGESVTEVTIGSWLKSDGDFVEADEPICEIESEKATLELPAEKAGIIKILFPEGQTVKVGEVIAEILVKEDRLVSDEKKAAAAPQPPAAREGSGENEEITPTVRVSPVAAKMMAEKGIPASGIKGTGPGGRITKEDVLKAVKEKETAQTVAPVIPAVSPTISSEDENYCDEFGRHERRVPMSTLRKTIARRLVESKNTTAMLTTFNEVDMSAIKQVRDQYQETFLQKYGVKLGFMSFFVKAVCIALEEFPVINASVDGENIVYHDYCDIAIAVSTPYGLVVPVIRNAERLSPAEIEAEVALLAQKARDKKLSIDEMNGGTFSITNGGVFGSLLSTPIINPPQSAILGMHKIQERPVAVQGEVVIRPMMYLAMSYDHRIIDGKESVQFLVRVKELLEDPSRLLLEV